MFVTAEQQALQSVAMQLMNEEVVALEDQKLRVKRVGSGRLRMVQFKLNGRMFEAIEQNPMKPSRWGQMARAKHQVVQFRDVATHKYVAVAVDGEITEYGRESKLSDAALSNVAPPRRYRCPGTGGWRRFRPAPASAQA